MYTFTPVRASIAVLLLATNVMSQQAPVQSPVTTQPSTTATTSTTPIPDAVLYRDLFMRYRAQEQFALHIDAEKKRDPVTGKLLTGTAVRAQLMNRIGLSAADDLAVKTAALDYMTDFGAYMQQRGQIFTAVGKAMTAAGIGLPGPTTTGTVTATTPSTAAITSVATSQAQAAPQIAALDQQDKVTMQNHILQIQTAMGARFQILDAYVHNVLASTVHYQAIVIKSGVKQ